MLSSVIWRGTYGIKYDSDSEGGNPLPPLHLLLFPISSMGSFIRTTLQTGDSTCHGLCGALAGTRHREREREMFYLTTHSTHFIYGYMASYIWLRTILIVRKETRCRHIGYSYRLTAMVLLYAPSHRQDNTYHGLCYTSRGALAGTRNSSRHRSMGKI